MRQPVERVEPRALMTVARAADALVYVAGAAGVIAGGLLYRGGSLGLAILTWVLTFIAGAVLRLAAWVARGVAETLARLAAIEQRLAAIEPHGPPEGPSGPAGRPGWGWHR